MTGSHLNLKCNSRANLTGFSLAITFHLEFLGYVSSIKNSSLICTCAVWLVSFPSSMKEVPQVGLAGVLLETPSAPS